MEEKAELRNMGTKLKALKNGEYSPQSPEERHFVEMCAGRVDAVYLMEHAWNKYCSLLEQEKEFEKRHKEELKKSPEHEQYLRSRYSGRSIKQSRNNAAPTLQISKGHSKKCSYCHDAGFPDCPKCGGRGWIEK